MIHKMKNKFFIGIEQGLFLYKTRTYIGFDLQYTPNCMYAGADIGICKGGTIETFTNKLIYNIHKKYSSIDQHLSPEIL